MPSIFEEPLPFSEFDESDVDFYILKIIDANENHGERKCLEEKVRGRKLFKAKFINDFQFTMKEPEVHITSKVRAEMKKKTYTVKLVISADCSSEFKVIDAECECPGGTSPADCKHVFAVLHFIVEYYNKELHSAPTEVLQQWHQPSKKIRCSPKKVEEFTCASSFPKRLKTTVNFDALVNLPYGTPIFSVIDSSDFNYEDAIYDASVPLPLLVDQQLDNFCVPVDICENDKLFFIQNVLLQRPGCYELERKTVGQHNDLWKEERHKRLTASNFHRILSRRDNFGELSLSLLNPPNIQNIRAVRFGLDNEDKVKKIVHTDFPDYKFRNVGLIVNPNFPFLGASPDGLLSKDNETLLVEIKTVFNEKQEELCELLTRPSFCLGKTENGELKLKKNHIYYHQIQGQLAVSNVPCCIFALYYKHGKVHYEKVMKSEVYWQINFEKLKKFYFNYHLKNLCCEYSLK